MKILITGSGGMVARSAIDHFRSKGDVVVGYSRAQMDISERASVFAAIDSERPDAVVNCAAYTNVDGAETNESASYAANADGPENLALSCREFGTKLVTISTDYVFDGSKDGFYVESDTPNPLSLYAKSKYEGELRVIEANPDAIVLRSGWIYGPGGTNFLSVMPALLAAGRSIKVVSDSRGTPTYAGDLVIRIRELIESRAAGLFHAANSGNGTTYLGFAEEICRRIGQDTSLLEPVTDAEMDRPARRPPHSMIRSERENEIGLTPLPEWADSLDRFISLSSSDR